MVKDKPLKCMSRHLEFYELFDYIQYLSQYLLNKPFG